MDGLICLLEPIDRAFSVVVFGHLNSVEGGWRRPPQSHIKLTMTPKIQDRGRQLAIWALLTPFLILSLLSPSVMPMHIAGSGVVLTLCSGDGPVELRIDPETGEPAEKSPADTHEGCAWANARIVVADLAQPALPPIFTRIARTDPAPVPGVLRRAEKTGQPPTTGPPATV
jgi:hypothetical protein